MNTAFINRQEELDFLQRKFQSGQAELLIFRGRRRVGKTFLLKEFSRKVNGLYFLATITSVQDQLANFSKIMSQYFGDPLLETRPLVNWEEFFLYLSQQIKTRTAIIIDEYPYLLESQPGLSTILQKYWDEYFHTNPNFFLVINGSALSMMEKETLESKAPLYGRRTGQWFVSPFNLQDNNLFFSNTSLIRAIEWYTLSGGIPYYSRILARHRTPLKAIEQEILAYGEVLYEEVEFLLRGEFRSPRSYFPILKAIARGSRKFGEISSRTGYDRSNLTKYLSALEKLKLIRREVPVTETNPAKSKKGLFFINDYFMNFWFQYVFPNQQALETGRQQEVFEQIVKPTFNHYVSGNCEPIIYQLLRNDYFKLNLTFERIGRYWDRHTEIDIWGYTADNNTVIGEIKWTDSPVDHKLVKNLEAKVKHIQPFVTGNLKQMIVSKSGFQKGLAEKYPQVIRIDLSSYHL